jgi:hypothetical protein
MPLASPEQLLSFIPRQDQRDGGQEHDQRTTGHHFRRGKTFAAPNAADQPLQHSLSVD